MSKKHHEARQLLYVNLMSEIKGRLETVAYLVGNSPLSLAARYECGFLQLRMICEVLAIACLTAHGDVVASKNPRLREAWSANDIIKGLGKLHPDFFPVPAQEILSADGKFLTGIHLLTLSKEHLSKDDLRALYGRCGDILHRGNLNDIAPRSVKKDDLLEIANWHNKVMRLLNRHFIEMTDSNGVYILMQDKKTKRVTLLELTRVPGGALSVAH